MNIGYCHYKICTSPRSLYIPMWIYNRIPDINLINVWISFYTRKCRHNSFFTVILFYLNTADEIVQLVRKVSAVAAKFSAVSVEFVR